MTSKPASSTNHIQTPGQDEQPEAKKIPLKQKRWDVASQMRSVKQAGPELAGAAGDHPASVEQTLKAMDAIEQALQHKRKQIEEIQTRQEALALEYRQLGKSLESTTKDFAQEFAGIIGDLETGSPIAKPSPDDAPEKVDTSAGLLADSKLETPKLSEPGLEGPDLPPLPEFLDRKASADPKDESDPLETDSAKMGWLKLGKK